MNELTLGEKLRLVRQRRGLRQTDLGTMLGCRASDIHRVERGYVRDPHWGRILAWSRALDISLDWLAGRDNQSCPTILDE